MMYSEYFMSPIDIPIKPEPNPITGEGHGHYRPLTREKPPKNHRKHKRAKIKMASQSRRKNRV